MKINNLILFILFIINVIYSKTQKLCLPFHKKVFFLLDSSYSVYEKMHFQNIKLLRVLENDKRVDVDEKKNPKTEKVMIFQIMCFCVFQFMRL